MLQAVAYQCSFSQASLSPPTLSDIVSRIAAGSILVAFPGYYIFHSDKNPGAGQAFKKETRRNGSDPSQEFRDLRDSPVKTLEDKKRKEAGKEVVKGR